MAESPIPRFRYRAFISYSHEDKAWARWLHRALETYRVPRRLVGTETAHGVIPRRLNPVFRDRDELTTATDLGREIRAALAESECLIVICSPAAARSRWVNEEVLAYKQLGHSGRIRCLIVAGEARECFCPALRCDVDAAGQPIARRAEPIAADARPHEDGKGGARLKLIAGMLGVRLDVLRQRETQRRRRRLLLVTGASLLGMVVATVLAVNAYVARNEARERQAQAQQSLNFMLGDLHEKLAATGRLELMDAVTEKVMTTIAAIPPKSLTDVELSQQSRALVQIGEIRMKEARPRIAMEAFQRAYQRSAELTSRHPRKGAFLYDRAQAEYWIGNTFWDQRDLAAAQAWLTRYRDSTRALAGLDPRNRDWQLETTYGEHNLAVLALHRGDLDTAQRSFDAELATQRRLAAAQPDNAQLAADAADTVSWLGNVAEQRGDLAGAQRLFGEQVDQLAALRKRYPEDFRWLAAWAAARTIQGAALLTTGRDADGTAMIGEATAAYVALTGHDPQNAAWALDLGGVRIRGAALALAAGDLVGAETLLTAAEENLSGGGRPGPAESAGEVQRVYARFWLLRARMALQRGAPREALVFGNRALAAARDAAPADATGAAALADQADALLVIGMAQRIETSSVRPPAWRDAHALLAKRAPASYYWRLLDPWLRLCQLTGDAAGVEIARARLAASGYVPQQAWPASIDTAAHPPTAGDEHDP